MRLQYRLNFGDFLLFQAIHQFSSVPLQVMYLLLSWWIYHITAEQTNALGGVIAATIAYSAMWALQLAFNVVYLYSNKNQSLFTEHIIELRDDAFYEETQYNQSIYYWRGIVKVVRRLGLVAVYVTAHLGHVIPRRAFSSAEQRDQFYATVKQRMRAAELAAQSK